MELIKGYARAQAEYESQTDQMNCGCDRGFCDCDECYGCDVDCDGDGIEPGYDGILGEG